MNARVALVLAILVLASGCASTQSASRDASPRHRQVRYVQDTEYMREYERTARRRSIVQVHWIHPPVKRVVVE